MPQSHILAAGENIFDVAGYTGFSAEQIWNLPENKDLVARRKYMNILEEGDVLFLPERVPFSRPCLMDQRHLFRRLGIPPKLRLQLLVEGEPKANLRYTLTIDGVDTSGVTDSSGNLEVFVPANAISGQLLLADQSVYTLNFSLLLPISETRGVQNRLANLGFLRTPPSGEWDEETAAAILAFQARLQIPQTGTLDALTRQKLEDVHDLSGAVPPAGPPHG